MIELLTRSCEAMMYDEIGHGLMIRVNEIVLRYYVSTGGSAPSDTSIVALTTMVYLPLRSWSSV